MQIQTISVSKQLDGTIIKHNNQPSLPKYP